MLGYSLVNLVAESSISTCFLSKLWSRISADAVPDNLSVRMSPVAEQSVNISHGISSTWERLLSPLNSSTKITTVSHIPNSQTDKSLEWGPR